VGSGPGFDAHVPPGGYRWWYVDALSEDRRHGLTVIGFVGSVFSPYYHWAGRRDPDNHVALNVALYGPRGGWAMTERGRGALTRDPVTLAIGPSAMEWDGTALTIRIDEVTAPIPSRLRGLVRLYPDAMMGTGYPLDPTGSHVWRPIATRAAVEVMLDRPSLNWRGEGYFDSNYGPEPLQQGFRHWRWSRAHLRRDTAVLYEGERRDGSGFAMGLRFDPTGGVQEVELPPEVELPRTGWRMPRLTRCDAGADARIRATWEDTPFYARTALSSRLFGEAADAVHESLSLDRLDRVTTRLMLPFRMPRVFR
jgi:carotenoid 1,2-hydratase